MSRKLFHSLPFQQAGPFSVGLDRLSPLTGVDLANIRLALSSSSSSNQKRMTTPRIEPPAQTTRHAAVLLGLCNTGDRGPGLILTVRSQKMRTHPGEISFPGGHQDPQIDQSLLGTALREAHEEVGLVPQQMELLGSLEPLVSNSGSTLVWPFVVFIHSLEHQSAFSTPAPMIPRLMSPLATKPLRSPALEDFRGKHQVAEVELVFQISLAALLEPDRQSPSSFRNDPQRPYLEWNVEPEIFSARNNAAYTRPPEGPTNTSPTNHKLWGLTGWLIHSFLRKIRLL
ncbi:hypothetical protein PtA15_6A399 [Puccinia triticina]|uniref:Nudix hydrolase domain-containing protein n=1 Tax=Puccinia triticina TaxID=208348 RepID=A0ABY7CM37_9BASI|nr:uncharacterized protein PtA15_6A399 [Puccinia triticina]WAQ85770.1 hypothetical protein PtA15_6A399 [Puccinia triticina]WAR55648.1 hypothetical protein PtB15_6B391 [Puccinia triticina]